MEKSESEALAQAEWEFDNNPSFANFRNNRRMRKLAIEQGSFKPAPDSIK